MTEQEWLACGEPQKLEDTLEGLLGGKLPDRKYRLYGCACVRRIWRQLPDDALRVAIETCERFADAQATAKELATACKRAGDTYEGIGDILVDHSILAVEALCRPKPWLMTWEGSSGGITAAAAEALHTDVAYHIGVERERRACAALFREVFGNPFRPVALEPAWQTPSVVSLAHAAYDNRILPAGTLEADRLAILADALEEAGCDSSDILSHLRLPGNHVRGCWVVDVVLSKDR